MFKKLSALTLLAALAAVIPARHAAAETQFYACGTLEASYGPFDYSNQEDRAKFLPIVEKVHFSSDVENLSHGDTGPLAADLSYVLAAFPNHHRALWAMARLHLQSTKPPVGARWSMDCIFERAERWRPEDGIVRMINGMYLAKKGDLTGAAEQYQLALQYKSDSAEVHYNAGLFYLQNGEVDKAREQARIAYSMGHPQQGLRHKLDALGPWENAIAQGASKP
jgi:tetratricopeptide (TPR) repeat protein